MRSEGDESTGNVRESCFSSVDFWQQSRTIACAFEEPLQR
jgi:hypothetical protein